MYYGGRLWVIGDDTVLWRMKFMGDGWVMENEG